jgi:adenylate kinase family enzyme
VIGRPLGAIVLLGLPGAGKTTLAAYTALRRARRVSRDEVAAARVMMRSATIDAIGW